jgi:hypothetical protein
MSAYNRIINADCCMYGRTRFSAHFHGACIIPPPCTPWLLPPLCAAATFILINVRSTVVAHLEEQRADISDPADPAALLE